MGAPTTKTNREDALRSLALRLGGDDAALVVWALGHIEKLERLDVAHPTYCKNCGTVSLG